MQRAIARHGQDNEQGRQPDHQCGGGVCSRAQVLPSACSIRGGGTAAVLLFFCGPEHAGP